MTNDTNYVCNSCSRLQMPPLLITMLIVRSQSSTLDSYMCTCHVMDLDFHQSFQELCAKVEKNIIIINLAF